MNSIVDAIDWGAYAHFRYLASWQPGVAAAMQTLNAVATSDIALGILAALTLGVFLVRGQTRTAGIALAIFAAGYLIATFVPPLLGRERPPDAARLVPDEAALAASFPAGGVLLFALATLLLAFAVWPLLGRRWLKVPVGLGLALLVVAVCMSQFYLGLHFVTDVAVGLLTGIGLALLVRLAEPG